MNTRARHDQATPAADGPDIVAVSPNPYRFRTGRVVLVLDGLGLLGLGLEERWWMRRRHAPRSGWSGGSRRPRR